MTRPTVARAAAGMGAVAAVSRGFGAIRVLVIAAVLGATYLGNTFQGSNQFSTVLFELLAAGALSAVLVPTFVELLDSGERERAESLAGGVLGVALVVLGGVVVVGVLAAPWIAELLASGVSDPVIAAQQTELATYLLRWFIPQLLLYAVGAIATAVLHAERVFAVPAAAPIANTVIMVGFLLWFRVVAGPDPSLDLTSFERLLLALAGTLGVAGFVAVPCVALHRRGFRLRPRFSRRDPDVRRLLGLGGWATLQHAASALLLGAAIVVGGAVEGGVVAFQVGWFFFLAPYGVIAQPIQTAVLPEVVGELGRGDLGAVGASLRWSTETMAVLLLPVTAALLVLAEPIADVMTFGAAREGDGIELIAGALASLGLGLLSYGLYLLYARTWYALGNSRVPAFASLASALVGVVAMVATGVVADGHRLVVGLGLAHTVAFTLAALALGIGLHRRLGVTLLSAPLLVSAAMAVALGGVAAMALALWSPTNRFASLAALICIGGVLGPAYLLAARRLGLLRPRPSELARVLS